MGERGDSAAAAALYGDALVGLGRYEEAVFFADVGADAPTGDRQVQSLGRQVQAKVFAHRGEHSQAVDLAREAVSILEGTDLLPDRADALLTLATVQRLTNDAVDAQRSTQQALGLYELKGHTVGAQRARRLLAGEGRRPRN